MIEIELFLVQIKDGIHRVHGMLPTPHMTIIDLLCYENQTPLFVRRRPYLTCVSTETKVPPHEDDVCLAPISGYEDSNQGFVQPSPSFEWKKKPR